MQHLRKHKKRLSLEEVLDEALKVLPRGMDIPVFTEWVNETITKDKRIKSNEKITIKHR